MRVLLKLGMLSLVVCCACFAASAASAASIAVFPLQELREGRNDANLPMTRLLIDELVANGNEVIAQKTIIAFMANNRIRNLGHLESYHISRVRSDLGAAFILLGTVSQSRERPEAALGLTLNLIRTSDQRSVWSYVGSLSSSDERRVLGIGEPRTVAALQPLLLAEMMGQWPRRIINEVQQGGAIQIDLAQLEPKQARPGDTLRSRVRLRDVWAAGQGPRVFFKADEQLHPATLAADGRTWEGSWVSGSADGNYPVALVLEWPHYGRTETALLGSYLIDGNPPLLEIELRGAQMLDGRPVFNRQVTILPRLLVRKPLSQWRLSFYEKAGMMIGDLVGEGALPGSFIWAGRATYGRVEDGLFQVVVEVWDLAGNSGRAEQWLEVNRSQPQIAMAVDESSAGVVVDLAHEGKVPLELWRMEMWTRDGQILARQEGQELPVKIELNMAGARLDEETQGFVFVQDVLGNKMRRDLKDLLPNLGRQAPAEAAEGEAGGISEKWVDEF